jgi:hypothetical protein
MLTKSIVDLAKSVDRNLRKASLRSPGMSLLTRLFEIIYLTSLKTEEGKALQVRIALVDPESPDPNSPSFPRSNRWGITRLTPPLLLSVPILAKLSKAADPWSSSLAAYYDRKKNLFIWGLIDQTVHFNTTLVHESEGGDAPPGICQILVNGAGDLSVYRQFEFVARLAQDALRTKQNDVFSSGPIHDCLQDGVIA